MTGIREPNVTHLSAPPHRNHTVTVEAIACHEAGHILTAHYYHRKVYSAELKSSHFKNTAPKKTRDKLSDRCPAKSQSARDNVHFESSPHLEYLMRGHNNPSHIWPTALKQTLITVRILFGGPIAQAFHQRLPFQKIEGGDDYRSIVNSLLLLERVRLHYPELRTVKQAHKQKEALDTLAGDVQQVLLNPRNHSLLENVANELLEKKKINSDEINKLLKPMHRHNEINELRRRIICYKRRQ